MILGFSLILVAITLLGIDCWNWLNTGVFAPVSLATIWQAAGLTEPVFDSETVQSIATDFFSRSALDLFCARRNPFDEAGPLDGVKGRMRRASAAPAPSAGLLRDERDRP